MKNLKRNGSDHRSNYTLNLEIGFLIALGVMVFLFRIDLRPNSDVEFLAPSEQEVVTMEEVIQTNQVNRPPPPPRPQIPVAVPNDEVISDDIIDLDAELDLDDITEFALPEAPKDAKEDKAVEEQIFVVVERMPDLIGGIGSVMKNLTYPEIAKKAGIEGRVYLQFIINERGQVENPKVVRGIGGGCDEAALEAIKKARFTPGLQRGKPVKVKYSLPIIFKLDSKKK